MVVSWRSHLKTENPLQVALSRGIGLSLAESDKEMELADEAKAYIEAVKAFDHLVMRMVFSVFHRSMPNKPVQND